MTHGNAPLSVEGRRRLVARCVDRPIAHVAAEMGISRACASKWVNRFRARQVLNRFRVSECPSTVRGMTSGARLPYDQKTYRALIPVGKMVGAFIDFEKVASLPPESFGPERDTDVSFVMVIKNSPDPLGDTAELIAEIESGTGCPVLPHTPPSGAGGGVPIAEIAIYIAGVGGAPIIGYEAVNAYKAVRTYLVKQIQRLKKNKDDPPAIKYKEIPFLDSKGNVIKRIRVVNDEIFDEGP